MALHPDFLAIPLAHRGLHDRLNSRPENSRAAFVAAIAGGYGIELDLQMSADGRAMVFHDDELQRLTPRTGRVRDFTAAELGQIALHGVDETIPTLAEILDLVAGRVPLLIELKDQDGALGPNVGRLEADVARCLQGYRGPVAVMGFNPHSIAALKAHAPGIVRGLVTCDFNAGDWPNVSAAYRAKLREMSDLDRVAASFVSHDANDLHNPAVARIKTSGLPVLCWTIRSAAQEKQARMVADNITFEGYCPPRANPIGSDGQASGN